MIFIVVSQKQNKPPNKTDRIQKNNVLDSNVNLPTHRIKFRFRDIVGPRREFQISTGRTL